MGKPAHGETGDELAAVPVVAANLAEAEDRARRESTDDSASAMKSAIPKAALQEKTTVRCSTLLRMASSITRIVFLASSGLTISSACPVMVW